MQHKKTTGIVLGRIKYGEADRIVTLLTPDYGKISAMAKGARRVKSKLAGGIELFSVSEIVFIKGKGDLHTLVSARLEHDFSSIAGSLDRTMYGYEVLKTLQKLTEEQNDAVYFNLLLGALAGLDKADVPLELVQTWFDAQLLSATGHKPNFERTREGEKLAVGEAYDFDLDAMALYRKDGAVFGVNEIKFCRLLVGGHTLSAIAKIQGAPEFAAKVGPSFTLMRRFYLA